MENNVNKELADKIDSAQKALILMLENADKICRELVSFRNLKGDNIVIPYSKATELAAHLSVSVSNVAKLVQSSTREDKAIWDLFNGEA